MNRNLITPAIVLLGLILLGYYYFQFTTREGVPGENDFRLANKYLEEGKTGEALKLFNKVLSGNPEYKEAYMGRAITLMQIGDYDASRESFDRAIALDTGFAAAYANRGILNDRTGRYEDAVRDYRRAVQLDPELAEGPGRIWKFLHNVSGRVPTIADRADYIEAELKKPEGERLLKIPEIDAQQRMYKK
jgi:tetratricopeptide (TPR) repeat protein